MGPTRWQYRTHPHIRLTALYPGTTQISRYQKGKTNLDFTEVRDSEWQWHQLGHVQVYTWLQTDNHASTPPLSFLQAGCPSCRPTNSDWLTDWVGVAVLHPTQHKNHHFGDAYPWLGYGKATKRNTTNARINQSKEIYYEYDTKKLRPALVTFYDIRPGNGPGLFSKEKISKEKWRKRISGEAYNINNKQTISIAPKSKMESRVHYTLKPERGNQRLL